MRPLSPMNEPETVRGIDELVNWWIGDYVSSGNFRLRRRSLRNTRQTIVCCVCFMIARRLAFHLLDFFIATRGRESDTKTGHTSYSASCSSSAQCSSSVLALQISIVFHCFLVDTLYLPNWIEWELCSYVIELSAQVHSGTKYCRGLSSI